MSNAPNVSRGVALAAASAATLLFTPGAQAQAYRIMPVGDSITVGYTDNPTWNVPYQFGYRSGLYTRLTNSGLPFQFVGNSPEPFDNKFGTPQTVLPPDLRTVNQDHHEGYGGQGTSFVGININSWLSANNPDIILLMIGINDIANGSATVSVGVKTNLNGIVQAITTNKPNANLIIAQITPYSTYTQGIVDYNTYIRDSLVPSYAAQGKHVTTVDQYANFGTGATVDSSLYSNGINHPNATGYDKMAQTWFAGIQALNLPATPPVAPVNLVNNSSFEAPVGAANSHNINPTGAGWSFTAGNGGAGSGIDRGSPYGAAAQSSAADGSQQAFLQSSGNGSITSITQAVAGFTAGQKYQLTFQSKAITGFTGANPFQVQMVGSSTTNLFGGADIVPVPGSYTTYTSEAFTATDPTMTLRFFDHGLNVVTSVSFIDAVSITAVPEPGTVALVLALGAPALLRRRRGR